MSSKKLIVGQIGCGAFAEGQDFPNYSANDKVECKWCCDISLERAKAMAQKFSVPNVTADYMDVINDDEVDFIKVCTSHDVHLPIIEAAAKAGKHIFCEKPMAMEEEEGFKIIRAVRRGGVKLCVDLNRRMSPSLHSLKEKWVEQKENPKHQPWRYVEAERELYPEEKNSQLIIRIQDETVSYRMIHMDPLRGGGALIGESVHWLDLACWFFNDQVPTEINAWGSSRFSHGINLRFSKGDEATITFSGGGTFDYPKELFEVASNGALFRNEFFVENQYYGIPDLNKETFELQHDSQPEVGSQGGFLGYMEKYKARVEGLANSKDGHSSLAVDKGHRNMLDKFCDAIINDTPSPCDEKAGFLSTYLAKLAIKSIETRQTLPVPLNKVLFDVI
jgi:predicted dehydrogenase